MQQKELLFLTGGSLMSFKLSDSALTASIVVAAYAAAAFIVLSAYDSQNTPCAATSAACVTRAPAPAPKI